jgi:hypothetical protein
MTILLHCWPESMTAEVAAAYCSVDKRRLPPASFHLGKSPRWRRRDLDAWLDSLAPRRQEQDPWLTA